MHWTIREGKQMTEEQGAQPQPPTGAAQPPGRPAIDVPVMDAKEVEEGKAFAVLSYALFFVPFFLIPLIMRNNDFSLYHAKQCLLLWIAGAAGSMVCSILSMACIGLLMFPILFVACLVFTIMGLMTASKGEVKPLPVIGKYAEDWFKGIRKV